MIDADSGGTNGRADLRRAASILVVDDEMSVCRALSRLLTDAGYRVTTCIDGALALDVARSTHPDVILLDLRMPNFNGWQFRLAQKQDPSIGGVPVIIISVDYSPQAAVIDAEAYLSKPFKMPDLIETLERVLRIRKRCVLAAEEVEIERLSSVGALAAGVAHEINNPLAFVLGNLEMSMRGLSILAEDAHRGDLESVDAGIAKLQNMLEHGVVGAKRIRNIVRHLSQLVRDAEAPLCPLDVVPVLHGALALARQHLDARARVVVATEPVPPVLANEAKLTHAFLNLLLNAAQAILEGNPEQHVVRVRVCSGDVASVRIEIADTGVGIAPEIRGRIFEPFVTTKPVGSGMGLGLTICHRIITDLGGRITVESEPKCGSVFHIELPAAQT